ncbi:hypothetical protein UlMin_022047 [Ulmus minor]
MAEETKSKNLREKAIMYTEKSPGHHKETHGLREDIDEKTPLDDVKAPNVFERAKEEVEALIETIHSKKESPTHEKRLECDFS